MKIKRYLTKAVALVLVIALGNMPLLAADAKKDLTLESAIRSAVATSDDLAINSKKTDTTKEQLNAIDNLGSYTYNETYISKNELEQQRDFIKDRITYKVTSKYDEIVLLNKEIAKIEKDITLTNKEIKQLQIKQEKGLVDSLTYEQKQLELTTLQSLKSNKEQSLKDAQISFKNLTSIEVAKYNLEENTVYEPLSVSGTVEGYIGKQVDLYIKYSEEAAKYKKDTALDRAQDAAGGTAPQYSTYLNYQTQADVSIATVESAKKSYKEQITKQYTNLAAAEKQLELYKSQLAIKEKTLKVLDIKYKAGLVSTLDYEQAQFEKEELEINILNTISQCNTLKMTIEKPWVLFV